MNKGRVLSIDDDENLQTVVSQYLEDDGYTVLTANNVESALEQVKTGDLHVILLDLVLPDGEGLSLIPQFKNITQAPIIVVSGKTDTMEKVVCLEMGADDYIVKPFEMRELSARIKVATRRGQSSNNNEQQSEEDKQEKIKLADGSILDRTQYQLYLKDGESAELTTGEFKLLEALVLSTNRVLSREQLFDLTRDGRFDAYDRAIDIQIGRIRKKLGDDDGEIIKTVRGAGYMFSKKV